MGVFIVSTFTANPQKSTMNHLAILLPANSIAEAEGLGLQHVRKLMPISEGWSNYDAVVNELSKESLLLLAKTARSESEIKR